MESLYWLDILKKINKMTTLKEKFKIINCTDCDMPYCEIKCTILTPSELDKLQQITDEFAIGFAEWLVDYYDEDESYRLWDKSTEELLEIYKNEKGL